MRLRTVVMVSVLTAASLSTGLALADPLGDLGLKPTVSGTVTDREGVPLAGARVSDSYGHYALTDSFGHYRLQEQPGFSTTLRASKLGFGSSKTYSYAGIFDQTFDFAMQRFVGIQNLRNFITTLPDQVDFDAYTYSLPLDGSYCLFATDEFSHSTIQLAYKSTQDSEQLWHGSFSIPVSSPRGWSTISVNLSRCSDGFLVSPGTRGAYLVDLEAPTARFTRPTDGTSYLGDRQIGYSDDGRIHTVGPLTFEMTASDDSAIADVLFSLDGFYQKGDGSIALGCDRFVWTGDKTVTFSCTVPELAPGEYTMTVDVLDSYAHSLSEAPHTLITKQFVVDPS